MHSGGFADGQSRVSIKFGDGVSPQCAFVLMRLGLVEVIRRRVG